MARPRSRPQSAAAAPPARETSLPPGLALGVAFLTGWVIMQLEILGGRVLAPYFGYSIYQWGALIGVVMAALAAGYWLGGRVGDGPRPAGFLLAALGASALLVLAVPPLAGGFMPATRALGPAWGAVAATAILLGAPSVLLATTSPIVIRLTATALIARTAGRVYAVSTVGSIAGTFFTAFYIIPELGSRLGHFVAAGLILVAAAGLAVGTGRLRYIGALAVLAGVLGLIPARQQPGVTYREESVHNIITVQDAGAVRYLYLNYTAGAQTIMVKNQVLTGSYYDYFLLGPHINGGRKALFLGSAGGTALKQLVQVYPEVEVTGVELDPKVVEVANRFFEMGDHPRIRQVVADARWYLRQSEERYDLIYIDLYVTGHIPFFTATQEFFRLVHDRLGEDGILMVNILALYEPETLVAPFVRTVRTAFPSTFTIGHGNYILIASKTPLSLKSLQERLAQKVPQAPLATVMARALPRLRVAAADGRWPVFTDDRSDVEFRTFRAVEGGY